MVMTLEVRTFEQRFGDHCPFCGKSWGDPNPCGDSRADWTIRDGLRMLFAGNKDKNCAICDKPIPMAATFCVDCREHRMKYQGREKSARYKERHAKPRVCVGCGETFMAKKTTQAACSLHCAMVNRRRTSN
jgi:predicted nucleic acid-binding Zn ribbon protein